MRSREKAEILRDAGEVLDRHVSIIAGMLEAAGVERELIVAVLSIGSGLSTGGRARSAGRRC